MMADDRLRMTAEVVDQFSEPLRKLKGLLNDIHKDRETHSRTQRQQDEQLDQAMTRLTRGLKEGVRPALSMIGLELGSVGGAITGVIAKSTGFAETVRSLDQLSRQTQTSTTHLREIGAVAAQIGLSFDQATQGFKAFTENMSYFRAGVGATYDFIKQRPILQPLITDLQHARTDFEAFQKLVDDVRKLPIGEAQKREVLKSFGLPEEWASLEGAIGGALEKAGSHIAAFSKNSVENAKKFTEAWTNTKLIFDNMGNAIGANVLPKINQALSALDRFIDSWGKLGSKDPSLLRWGGGKTPDTDKEGGIRPGPELERFLHWWNSQGSSGGGPEPWRGRGTLPRPLEQQGLPSHQFGSDYIQQTGFALLHRGERVMPADAQDREKRMIIEGTKEGVRLGMIDVMRDIAGQSTLGGGGMQMASYHAGGGGMGGGGGLGPRTATPSGPRLGSVPPGGATMGDGSLSGISGGKPQRQPRGALLGAITKAWRDQGMGSVGIAGVLGNIEQESAFNPNLRHPDQPHWGGEAHFAHGLYQEGGAEWNHYADWLKREHPGSDWRDPSLQSEFAAWNLKHNYPGVWRRLMGAKSPEEAAVAYRSGYLKPAPSAANDPHRTSAARRFYNSGLLDAAKGSSLMGGGGADISGKARLDINIKGLPKGSRTWMDSQGSIFDNTYVNTGNTGALAPQ